MIVFRVQDNDGRGPFKPGFSSVWVEPRDDHDNLPPWYYEFGRVDKSAIAGMTIGSACTSEDQLKRWFTESEYKKLLSFRYKSVKLEASVLAESDVQCFVQRSKPFNKDFIEFDLY